MTENPSSPTWSENDSADFIDYGRYFVFDRELQIDTLCSLVPAGDEPFHVLELGCGEGLLAEAILERYPACHLHGLDKSAAMLTAAGRRLSRFGSRFIPQEFDLAAPDWRKPAFPVRAVVSSLVIHHLDAAQKQQLFRDVYTLLEPGGALLIADLVLPETEAGVRLAARAYDSAVRERALQLDGNLTAFEAFQKLNWNYFHHPDDPLDKPSSLLAQVHWLKEADFKCRDVFWVRAGHAIFGGFKTA
jgi:trans-aconitate methyltransferase